MAYSLGGESGFTQPMAFAMSWGLGFAALGTLIFLPVTLVIREDILKILKRVLRKMGLGAPKKVADSGDKKTGFSLPLDDFKRPSLPVEGLTTQAPDLDLIEANNDRPSSIHNSNPHFKKLSDENIQLR
jgi:hypothetical protein